MRKRDQRICADINNFDILIEPKIGAGEILWKTNDANMEIPVLVRDIIDETGNYGKYLWFVYFTNKTHKLIQATLILLRLFHISDEINCRVQDLRDGRNTVCKTKYDKSTLFQGCDQDIDEYIRKYEKNPKITESMLGE